jgi:uncharacterized integral membrane protein (TIGR00698 family)
MTTSTAWLRVRPDHVVPSRASRREPRTRRVRELAPGLAACAAGLLAAWGVHRLVGAVPMLTAALLLGILAVNTGVLPSATRAGSRFAASTVMRAGVVLLGLQVALADVAGLGWQTIVMTVLVLLTTLFGTRWLGRRMGLSARTSLLVASGFAICGASAVAAVDGVLGTRDGERDGDRERDAATAVALVTLCGTLAIVVMPAAGHLLGLSAYDQGRWIGASVHDVGQVVATATIAGPVALVPAIAVKLIRVAMLAPVTTAIALRVRRADPAAGAKRPPVLPVFLIAFLAMVALRSTGEVPQGVLDAGSTVKDLLFAAALFGLGSAVRLGPLIRTGRRALLLGLTSWVLIAGISYAGVLLTR